MAFEWHGGLQEVLGAAWHVPGPDGRVHSALYRGALLGPDNGTHGLVGHKLRRRGLCDAGYGGGP